MKRREEPVFLDLPYSSDKIYKVLLDNRKLWRLGTYWVMCLCEPPQKALLPTKTMSSHCPPGYLNRLSILIIHVSLHEAFYFHLRVLSEPLVPCLKLCICVGIY